MNTHSVPGGFSIRTGGAHLALIGVAALVISGCGASSHDGVGSRLVQDAPDLPVYLLEEELDRHPGDSILRRELGVAWFRSGRADSSLAVLESLRPSRPHDARLLFYLGASYEKLDSLDAAVAVYESFRDAAGPEQVRSLLAARMRDLLVKLERRNVRRELAREADRKEVLEQGIAILPFESRGFDDRARNIGRGLSAILITDLGRVRSLRLVERLKTNVILDELELALGKHGDAPDIRREPQFRHDPTERRGQQERLAWLISPRTGREYYDGAIDGEQSESLRSAARSFQEEQGIPVDGLVGPQTKVRLEEAVRFQIRQRASATPDSLVDPAEHQYLFGAATMIAGSVVSVGPQRISIEAEGYRWNEPSMPTGSERRVEEQDELARFLDLEKRVALGLLDVLNIDVTDPERAAILGYRPTGNLAAFLAFCGGLYFEDTGDLSRARDAYLQAADLDPFFREAREAAEDVEVRRQASGDGGSDRIGALLKPGSESSTGGDPDPVGDRLGSLLDQVRGAFDPGDPEDVDVRIPVIGLPPPPPDSLH